jgi:hypothetical protein
MVLGALKKGTSSVLGLIARYPWQFAVIALLVASAWLWHGKTTAIRERDAVRTQIQTNAEAYKAAQQQALADALKAKHDTEAHYAALAIQADEAHDQGFAQGRAAADAYIASHRLPAQPSGASGATAAAANDHGPAIPEKLPSGSVIYSAADVQTCAADYEYALDAHNWALSLGASK